MATSNREIQDRIAETLRARNAAMADAMRQPTPTPEAQPAAADEPRSEPAQETQAEAVPDEATPVPAETEHSAEPMAAEAESAAASEPEGTDPIRSFSELAEYLDTDLSVLYGLEVPLNDGSRATIGDIKNAVQDVNLARRRADELDAERKAFQAEREGLQRRLEQSLAVANGILESEQEAILAEKSQIESLRADDPTEYALRRQDLLDRADALTKRREQLAQEYESYQAQQQQQFQQHRQQVLREQQQVMLRKIPEWADASKRETEGRELSAFLKAEGYSDEEISGLIDARALRIARLAMMHERGESKKQTAVKKVRGLPKRVKSTQKAETMPTGERMERDLRASLKKSGSHKDAQALIKHRLRQRNT